jgi:cell wall-associated NlpC family hydrolase
MSVTHDQIVAAARECIGTPWHHQGRGPLGPKGKLDCVGLLVHIGRSTGSVFHDCAAYSRRPDGVTLMAELDKGLVRLSDDHAPAPGLVLVFRTRRRQWAVHVGVVTPWDGSAFGLVHTYLDAGRCVEVPLDEWWRPIICAVYDWPGVR